MKLFSLSILFILSTLTANAQLKAVIKKNITQNQCSKLLIFEADTTGNNPKYIYTWDFGDLTTKINGIKVNHFYNTIGNGTKSYTVTLTVTDTTKKPAILTQTDTYNVAVKQLPDASMSVSGYGQGVYPVFATCNTGTPPKLTLNYTSFTNNTFYDVDWDNGAAKYSSTIKPTNIMSSYPNEGYYYLKTQVTGTNGCINRDTITFYYGKTPATLGITFKQGVGGVTFCAPITLSANIQNQKSDSKGTTYIVDFGDGINLPFVYPNLPDNITHTYTTSTCKLGGTLRIRIQSTNGCGSVDYDDQQSAKLKLSSKPKPYIIEPSNKKYCKNIPITFSSGFSEGYDADNFCTQKLSQSQWQITPNTGVTVTGTLTSDKLTATFSQVGTYTLKYTGTGACGSGDTTLTINILELPKAIFTPSKIKLCVGETINFSNQSQFETLNTWSIAPVSSTSYLFINGTNKNTKNVDIQFNTAGFYAVSLKAENTCGFESKKVDITTFEKTSFDFVFASDDCETIKVPNLTSFIKNVKGAVDKIILESPNLGKIEIPYNGSFGTLTFAKSEVFTLTLSGECGSVTKSAIINISPKATLVIKDKTKTVLCSDKLPLKLEATPKASDWYVDGVLKANNKVFFDFNSTLPNGVNEKDFKIKLSGTKCDIADSMFVKVYKKATFDFDFNKKDCKPLTFNLNDFVKTKDGKIDSIVWQTKRFGKLQNVDNLIFTKSDTITVTIFSPCGTITKTGFVYIEDKEILKIKDKTSTTICSDKLPLILNGESKIAGNWFVNGVKQTASKIYNFNPTLTANEQDFVIIYSGGVCDIADTMKVKVYKKATFNFTLSFKDCKPFSANLNTYVTQKDGKIDSIVWQTNRFGKLQNVDNVTFTKSDTITVTIFSPCGTIVKTGFVYIEDKEILKIKDKTSTTICSDKLPLILNGESKIAGNWFVNGVKATTSKLYNFNPTLTANEQNFVIVYSGGVCDIADTMKVKVYKKATFDFDFNKESCKSLNFDLNKFVTKAGKIDSTIWQSKRLGKLQNIDNVAFIKSDTVLVTVFSPCGIIKDTGFVTINTQLNIKIDVAKKLDTLCEINLPFILKSNISNPKWTINGKIYNQNTVTIDKSFITSEWTNLAIQCEGDTCFIKDNATLILRKQQFFTLPFQQDTCLSLSYSPKNYDARLSYKINGKIEKKFPIQLPVSINPYIVTASFSDICHDIFLNDTFYVSEPRSPKIILPFKDTVLCASVKSMPINVENKGGKWLSATVQLVGNTYIFTPDGQQKYTLIYSIGSGSCENRDTINVRIEDVPTLVFDDILKCTYSPDFPLIATPSNGVFSSVDCPQCIDNKGVFDVNKLNPKLNANVTYTYKTNLGCSYNKVATVTIEQPKADFIYTNSCEGEAIKVDSSDAQGVKYEWFINGIKTNIADTEKLKAGNYSLKMIAYTATCLDSISKNIYITTRPVLTKFAIDKIGDCAPVSVSFKPVQSAQKDVKYLFDFGRKPNDTTSVFNPQNIIYQVQQGGKADFKISLTAYNECFSITWDTVFTLKTKPKADIELDSSSIGCSPYKVTITNRSKGGEISSTFLNFGNGQSTTEPKSYYSTIYYTGDSTKIFKAFIVVKNTCGEDRDTVETTVKSAKIKAFYDLKDYKPCPNQVIKFSDSSTPKPDKLKWDFGDGSFSNEPNPTHIFAEANKQYKVILYAYSPVCEGYDSILHIVTTKNAPNIAFSLPIYGCENQPVIGFKNETKNAFKFVWKSENWQDSTNTSPTPIFDKSNQKINVSLTAYSIEGCANTLTKSLFVRAKPKPNFELVSIPICSPAQLEIKNLSQDATNYTWFVNNVALSNSKSPTLVLDKKGLYDIMLIADYENTCFDTLTKENIIELFDCQSFIPNAFTPNGEGQNNFFTIYGNSSLQKFDLQVYDRWGNLLYNGKNLKPEGEGWDGTFNDKATQSGVYVYQAILYYTDGTKQEKKGDVMLLR